MYMETPANVTDKIMLDSLQPDTEYNFMVSVPHNLYLLIIRNSKSCFIQK